MPEEKIPFSNNLRTKLKNFIRDDEHYGVLRMKVVHHKLVDVESDLEGM